LTCFGTTLTAKVAFPVLVALAKKSLGFGDEDVIELVFKVEVVDLRMRDEE
jgi:hypothetical protein